MFEAYLLYRWRWVGPLGLLALAALARPEAVREGERIRRPATWLHLVVLVIVAFVWVRWVFCVDLHDRDDAQHMFLLGGGVVLAAWRSGLARVLLAWILRGWLLVDPDAKGPMRVSRSLLEPTFLAAIPGWLTTRIGRATWGRDDLLVVEMERALRREESDLSRAVIGGRAAPDLVELAKRLARRTVALLQAETLPGSEEDRTKRHALLLEVLASLSKTEVVTTDREATEMVVEGWLQAMSNAEPLLSSDARWALQVFDRIPLGKAEPSSCSEQYAAARSRLDFDASSPPPPEHWLWRWRLASACLEHGYLTWALEVAMAGPDGPHPQLCRFVGLRAFVGIVRRLPKEQKASGSFDPDLEGRLVDSFLEARPPGIWRKRKR